MFYRSSSSHTKLRERMKYVRLTLTLNLISSSDDNEKKPCVILLRFTSTADFCSTQLLNSSWQYVPIIEWGRMKLNGKFIISHDSDNSQKDRSEKELSWNHETRNQKLMSGFIWTSFTNQIYESITTRLLKQSKKSLSFTMMKCPSLYDDGRGKLRSPNIEAEPPGFRSRWEWLTDMKKLIKDCIRASFRIVELCCRLIQQN